MLFKNDFFKSYSIFFKIAFYMLKKKLRYGILDTILNLGITFLTKK
jgi:hypothetical protein